MKTIKEWLNSDVSEVGVVEILIAMAIGNAIGQLIYTIFKTLTKL